MLDAEEAPAVPPFDAKGDIRLGYYLAGGVLIALGWGLGVVANIALHWLAPAGGFHLFHLEIGRALGPYAWATLGLGLFTGAFGVLLLGLAGSSPGGPAVLPGYDY